MKSGDIGRLDEDGFLQMVGRVKDLIIRGGENISPKEIEEVYGKFESVRDVQVVGTECEVFGEDVTVWVIPKDLNSSSDKKEIIEFKDKLLKLSQDKLSHFKQPKWFRVVDEFPLTATSKVKKNIIR